jgi:hypothetical protein
MNADGMNGAASRKALKARQGGRGRGAFWGAPAPASPARVAFGRAPAARVGLRADPDQVRKYFIPFIT